MSNVFESAMTTVKTWWSNITSEEWLRSVGLETPELGQSAACLLAGFTTGFLLKKYLRLLVTGLVISLLMVKGLEWYKIVIIDWAVLNTTLGFEPTATIEIIATAWYAWLKAHTLISAATVVGFVVGYKLG